MASRKPKYNPDDVERWVTVRGARIPIMKDGSFGVGTKDDDIDDDIDDEERAMDLVDSKDYIGDDELKKGVEVNLKTSGYDLGSRMTIESAEITRWDGKSDYGYVEATYKLYGGDYGKNGQEFTEELWVPVRKSKNAKSKNVKYDTSRATKNKPPIKDRFSFQIAMPHPSASNDSQMKATTKLAVSQITKQFENNGIKLSKAGTFNGSQFFTPDKGNYVVELTRTSMGDGKNKVSFYTRIWDSSTATGKTLMKRFKKK